MKTSPIPLILAGLLVPAMAYGQAQGDPSKSPPCTGGGPMVPQRSVEERWKSADKDNDGFLSMDEFALMPRIENLPAEKRTNLFNRLDKNADGKLGRGELWWIDQHKDGQRPPMQHLWELDVDKSGGVSFAEFKAGRFMTKLPAARQEELFRRLDTDGDGVITPKDKPETRIDHRGRGPGFKRPDGGKSEGGHMEPRQIIRQLDKDGDGALSFEEFRGAPAVRDLAMDEQKNRFAAMDKNHDLKLTPQDFVPPANSKHPEDPPQPVK